MNTFITLYIKKYIYIFLINFYYIFLYNYNITEVDTPLLFKYMI